MPIVSQAIPLIGPASLAIAGAVLFFILLDFKLKRIAIAVAALMLAAVCMAAPPPLPKPTPRAATKTLSPRLAEQQQSLRALPEGRVDYVTASKFISGTNYVWHGSMWATNVSTVVTVDIYSVPATPTAELLISWPVQIGVQKSANLLTWSTNTLSGSTSFRVPNTGGSEFFRVQLPNASATLEWDASLSANATGYKIYSGRTGGFLDFEIDVGLVTIYTLADLEPGGTYYYAVTAYDASGAESLFSNEVAYTVPLVEISPSVRAVR